MPHLVATLIYLSQTYSYYVRGDRSPLNPTFGHHLVFAKNNIQVLLFDLILLSYYEISPYLWADANLPVYQQNITARYKANMVLF